MIPGDDTLVDVWTVAVDWEGVASDGSAARGQFLGVRPEGREDRRVVAGEKRSVWDEGELLRPCRADAVATPQRL